MSPGGCDSSSFAYRRFNESGTLVASGTVRLDHAVNVAVVPGTEPGWISFLNLPSVFVNTNFYAFSINRGAPGWDALFEAFIDP